eukprot:Nitzschia sp. Nitz4//scaffold100_size80364//3224//7079//NITZ4_005332-RA/size80364-augustus-gene-0.10-mRNA-1//-1//CDS//3329532058//8919//frame0
MTNKGPKDPIPHDDDDESVSDGASAQGSHNEDSSSHTPSTQTSNAAGQGRGDVPDDIMAARETIAVQWSRILVIMALGVAAAVAGGLTYHWSRQSEVDDFESQFQDFAFEIEDVSTHNADNIFKVAHGVSTSITSMALSTNQVFPYVTIPHFEIRGEQYLNVTNAALLAFSPTVTDLDAWNAYAQTNQGWLLDSYAWRGLEFEPEDINDMFYVDEELGAHIPETTGQEKYGPLWMSSRAPLDTGVINGNLMRDSLYGPLFDLMEDVEGPVLSQVIDPSPLFGTESLLDSDDFLVHPESMFLEPVFDSFDASNRTVVGATISILPWDAYFSNLLHDGAEDVVCVLSNTCGDVFTYRVNGNTAIYLGPGDQHNTAYNYMGVEVPFGPSLTLTDDDANDVYCRYSIFIYPTAELEESYHSNQPAVLTTTVVLIFAFTMLVFVVYDYLVQRRQDRVHAAALKSNAIVTSLFPAEVRDRLFQHNSLPEQNPGGGSKALKRNSYDGTAKYRLKNYLDDDNQSNEFAPSEADASIPEMYETKPIADLFPSTTVMFADIAGFTAWSSVREPSQVFTLLETVYRAFDIIAKKRRVFKVETVGDCYVAVTGLPEPRKDHAVVMSRFARDCMVRMNELSHQLEVTLGPDTGDLAMRFGLHSGPVTAGVLRGDKSRFQLFGDTVNTAARIESTGMRNRIHLSQETAEQLKESGKERWVVPRTEVVVAKGKGEMKTYWLLPKENSTAADFNFEPPAAQIEPKAQFINIIPARSESSPKIQRLVEWNVDVLKRLLKLIVAQRTNAERPNHAILREEEKILNMPAPLEEVKEIVTLPAFKAHRAKVNPNDIQLPEEVVTQLRAYVEAIATMYRENPFHNFEHASHVTMSVSKLLSRIIAPDITIEEGRDVEADLHDHTYGITSDPLTQFAVVISALVHDVDHVGIPNYLLINENKRLGSMYSNKSVAEQNSVDLAWTTLMEPAFDDLRSALYGTTADLDRFRQLIVNTVLATDIFDKELQSLRKNRWDKAFKTYASSSSHVDINRKATIVIEHLIQASDVAHTMQHWHIYQKWNERLFAEMTEAYNTGRSTTDPGPNWYKGELGFFDNYIIPLAKKLKDCGVFGVSSDEYLNYALENRREWASKGEEVVAKMIEKYRVKDAAEEKEEEAAKRPSNASPYDKRPSNASPYEK